MVLILIIHTQLILSFVEVNSLCNSKGVSEHAGRQLPFNVIYLKVVVILPHSLPSLSDWFTPGLGLTQRFLWDFSSCTLCSQDEFEARPRADRSFDGVINGAPKWPKINGFHWVFCHPEISGVMGPYLQLVKGPTFVGKWCMKKAIAWPGFLQILLLPGHGEQVDKIGDTGWCRQYEIISVILRSLALTTPEYSRN